MKHSNPLQLNPSGSVSTPRNAFDLSHETLFTNRAGLLLPIFVQEVQEGDFTTIGVSNFSRTVPVNTAAFAKFRENVDFYFVPYRLMWRYYDQFRSQTTDYQTSLMPTGFTDQSVTPKTLPYVSANAIWSLLNDSAGVNRDIHGFHSAQFCERLLDMLEYPVTNDPSKPTVLMYQKMKDLPAGDQPKFNPFRLLAYQMVWNHFFRQTDWSNNEVKSFNIDDLAPGAEINAARFLDILKPRYATWAKDRFTSLKPHPLVQVDTSEFPHNEQLNHAMTTLSSSHSGTVSAFPVTGTAFGSLNANVSADLLRGLKALDNVARLRQMTPKTYREQIKSFFGVTPEACNFCAPTYLGSHDSEMIINEIFATAAGSTNGGQTGGEDSVLGQLAGKGISSRSHGGVIKFDAKEGGIIIGIQSFTPNARYDQNRASDFNTKLTISDYYHPSYDNLGLQPLISMHKAIPVDPTLIDKGTLNQVQGYQARYMEYKTRLDSVHGLFQSKMPLAPWTTSRNATTSNFITAQADFYVSPHIADPLFPLNADDTQISDPFLCTYKFDVTCTRNMSVLGVPTM